MFWVELTFEWYEDTMVFGVFIFIFLFRTNGKKVYLDYNNSVTVMVIFLKVLFWKLRATLTTTFWNTLQLKIRANAFIKTLVKIKQQKLTEVSGKSSVEQQSEPAL